MTFINDFEDKVSEVEKYFEFALLVDNLTQIERLSSQSKLKFVIRGKNRFLLRKAINDAKTYEIDQELRKILKSTCFLLLYNLVEGSITAALNAYFNSISSKRERFHSFKPQIKALWITFQYRLFKSSTAQNIVEALADIYNDVVSIPPSTIKKDGMDHLIYDYDSYASKIGKTEISGNIDARKIRELSELYGFLLPRNSSCDSLVEIKNRRNSLAHGESRFTEIGRTPIESIVEIKDESIKFLRSVLNAMKRSIDSEAYME